jgi:hypothetical protein
MGRYSIRSVADYPTDSRKLERFHYELKWQNKTDKESNKGKRKLHSCPRRKTFSSVILLYETILLIAYFRLCVVAWPFWPLPNWLGWKQESSFSYGSSQLAGLLFCSCWQEEGDNDCVNQQRALQLSTGREWQWLRWPAEHYSLAQE